MDAHAVLSTLLGWSICNFANCINKTITNKHRSFLSVTVATLHIGVAKLIAILITMGLILRLEST